VYIALDPRPVFNSSIRILPNNSHCGTHLPLLVPFIFKHFQESILQLLSLHIHAGMGGAPTSPIFRSNVQRPTIFRPIPFPFTLMRTLWHGQKLNSFVFRQLHTLCPKHPGWGYRSISECEPHSSSNLSVAGACEPVRKMSLPFQPSTVDCQPLQCSLPRNTGHGIVLRGEEHTFAS
jgi:hypothetical protein